MLTHRRLAAFGAALALLIAAATRQSCGDVPPADPTEPGANLALALAWGGFAKTTFSVAPLNADHTLSVRFMTAYDAAYRGVIIADESGSYHLGMAPYASLGRPALEVTVGGATLTYPLPNPVLTDNDFRSGPPRQPGRPWRQLAVTRRGSAIVVALDGEIVGSFQAGALPATGMLRLGRLAHPSAVQDQFYGFIDDVALWQPGFDGRELERLSAGTSERTHSGRLRARLDFDVPSAGGNLPISLGGSARLAIVSREHRAELDEPRLPSPQHETRLELPFRRDQVWMPIQGINSALTHNDVAAFAIDFIRVDPRWVDDNPHRLPGGSHSASEGQPVLAPAKGRVAALVDSHGDDERSATEQASSNFVCLLHTDSEVSCLLHIQAGAETHEALSVEAGQVLARVGRSGVPTVHLHFALCNLPESKAPDPASQLVTRPAAFSDYFVSTDFGRSWHHVERGVPGPGEWLTREPPRNSKP